MRSVLSADKTPLTTKEEFIDIKSLHVTPHLIGQWAYELLISF